MRRRRTLKERPAVKPRPRRNRLQVPGHPQHHVEWRGLERDGASRRLRDADGAAAPQALGREEPGTRFLRARSQRAHAASSIAAIAARHAATLAPAARRLVRPAPRIASSPPPAPGEPLPQWPSRSASASVVNCGAASSSAAGVVAATVSGRRSSQCAGPSNGPSSRSHAGRDAAEQRVPSGTPCTWWPAPASRRRGWRGSADRGRPRGRRAPLVAVTARRGRGSSVSGELLLDRPGTGRRGGRSLTGRGSPFGRVSPARSAWRILSPRLFGLDQSITASESNCRRRMQIGDQDASPTASSAAAIEPGDNLIAGRDRCRAVTRPIGQRHGHHLVEQDAERGSVLPAHQTVERE